eukprot:1157230-Pelagomonas_calceolata.AAC.1
MKLQSKEKIGKGYIASFRASLAELGEDRIGLHSCTCLQGQLSWSKKVPVTKLGKPLKDIEKGHGAVV